jgi:hypothetical protein
MADTRGGSNNIYTVLVLIAFLALAFGVGFVVWRHYQVFDGHPWEPPRASMIDAEASATA